MFNSLLSILFALVLAAVPVQAIIFLRKRAKAENFSQELLTALAIERLRSIKDSAGEEGYDFYPHHPADREDLRPMHNLIEGKSTLKGKVLIFFLGMIVGAGTLVVIAML